MKVASLSVIYEHRARRAREVSYNASDTTVETVSFPSLEKSK